MGPEGNNPRLTALWFNAILPLSGAICAQTEHPLPDLSDLMRGQARVVREFERLHVMLPLCRCACAGVLRARRGIAGGIELLDRGAVPS